jgi:signal transduction histidine kinase
MTDTKLRESSAGAREPAAPSPSSSAGTTSRPNILLVDDQPARLLSYQAVLSGLGVDCVRAQSGAEALERLMKQEFAVILLDVNMPGMDGFETARMIREHPRFERTPIIFITGIHVTELDQLKGYEVGAIDYISVPIVPEILRSKVAVLVELYQRRSELQVLNRALEEARAQLESQHASEMAQTRAQLEAIFENPSQYTTVLQAARNSSGEIVDWIYRNANQNSLDLLQLTRAGLLGRRISEVLGERAQRAIGQCTEVATSRETSQYETRLGDRDFLVMIFAMGDDSVVSSAIDITERKQAEVALRRSEERLRELDRRKDEFLAMLSHELRNPVAPIRNAAEVLHRLVSDDQQRSLVTMVQRQAGQLSRLLDDLLDVARITQGRIELRREVMDLATLIAVAVETVAPLVRAKGHQLDVAPQAQPLYVSADRVRLSQCLANILNNAVKYTDPHGKIAVRSYGDAGEAVIEIEDSGIGIAAEFLPRAFDLFAQSERSLDRSQGGLGIGLSICKQLVEMHGGRVTGRSAGSGHGATFTVRVPLVPPPMKAARTETRAAVARERVLVVDDNHDAADSLAMLLQLAGYETRTVYSGDDALELAATFRPETVLLDIGLPGMDGYEVGRRLKEAFDSIRLVAISGYGRDEDKQRTQAAGFDAHLVKPVDVSALEKVLSK